MSDASRPTLHTPAGALPLHDYRLRLGGREWRVLHTAAVLSEADEQAVLNERDRIPYGVALWPSAIALAHELAARGDALRGASVLELGAGTGLPGIVAATLGAAVVQTDRADLALEVCRRNGARNQVARVTYRAADWSDWHDDARYDLVIGADILYAERMHEALRAIFAANVAPGGRVLVADPLRRASFPLLEALDADGWAVRMSQWTIGSDGGRGDEAPRAVGVFELTPPA